MEQTKALKVDGNVTNNDTIYCNIAELEVAIPTAGNMISRCREYLSKNESAIDIKILEEHYDIDKWKRISKESAIYLESGFQFYRKLLSFNGMMLHASAIAMDGKAYLFSGPCRTGKSTHARLWQKVYGKKVEIINDDKPALRCLDKAWFVYGTPWCGKDGINRNIKYPLAGICFLKQGTENTIRNLNRQEAVEKVIYQTLRRLNDIENLDKLLTLVDQLVREIPIYELVNKPEPEAAILSYETMRKGAEEAGL